LGEETRLAANLVWKDKSAAICCGQFEKHLAKNQATAAIFDA
jgi:hypothetical protein